MTKKKLAQIEKRIKKIKSDIVLIDDMRPGSLTKQYRGPNKTKGYYQISYTLNMKSRTESVHKDYVDEVRRQIKNYKRFKALSQEWVELGIEHSKLAMKLGRDES